MSAEVTKTHLLDVVENIRTSLLSNDQEDCVIADSSSNDSLINDLARILSRDIDWMFGYTQDTQSWSHTNDLTVENPFPKFLSYDVVSSDEMSNYLYEMAEKYFKQNLIRSVELDWFYLDFITVVGFSVLTEKYKDNDFKAAYPSLHKAIEDYDGKNVWALIKYFVVSILGNFLVFGIAIFLLLVASDGFIWAGLISGFLIVWKFYGWYSQSKLYKKLRLTSAEKLSQYNSLYRLFSNGFVRWEMLEHDLKRLRNLSIDFPLVLDTAVTTTKNHSYNV